VHYVPNLRTGQQLPMYYQIAENFYQNRARLDLPALMPGLRQPALLIHGDQDETVPLAAMRQLEASQPAAEVLVVPGAGHMFGGAHPWVSSELPALASLIAERTAAFFTANA
jgi:pimeloyl-ACP methyl ester carboxylesterase